MRKTMDGKNKKQISFPVLLIAAVLVSAFAVWKSNPIDYSVFITNDISYVRGKVVSVNSEEIEDSTDTPGRNIGLQKITVMLTSGKNKGETVDIDNYLVSAHSVEVKKGTRVIVKCDAPEGITPVYTVYQYDRSTGIIAAGCVFLALLAAVGGTKGIRSAIALSVSVIVTAFGLIPVIYNGHSPIAATMIACMAITAVTLLLLNGFSKKTYVAVASTALGLIISVFFYLLIAMLLKVTGYTLEETEELIMVSRSTGLKISDVLFSGILLASLGAVMDTSMSISSAVYEMTVSGCLPKSKDLFASGMNIGRDMIGTMCQTLILAFAGSSIASLLVLVSYGTKLHQFLSSDYLAVEIFRSLTGSFAVIITVPVTSFLCSRVYTNVCIRKRKAEFK